MASLETVYPAQANSPEVELTALLAIGGLSATVNDDSIVPAAPMLLVLGGNTSSPETIRMTAKPGSNVLTIVRAVEGSAREWAIGTKVQRLFTAKDHNDMNTNIAALNTKKVEQEVLTTEGTGAAPGRSDGFRLVEARV